MDERTLSTALCGIETEKIIEAFDQLAEAFAEIAETFKEAFGGIADFMDNLAEEYEKAEFPPEREREEIVYTFPRVPIRRAPSAKEKRWRAAVFGHYAAGEGEKENRRERG